MKAAIFNKYGDSEVIEITQDASIPQLKENQVLVQNLAASINPIDWKVREGHLKDHFPLAFPVTIGGNFAGIVAEVGEKVNDFKNGQAVYGQALVLNGSSGSMAEYISVNSDNMALMPTNLNYVDAASLPLVGVSALQAIEDHINLQSGQKILIHGGSGGIGSVAIEIAKSKGAYVITTASEDSKEFVTALGADEVIDYKSQQFETIVKDLDAVFDTVGGETTDKSYQVLKKGGILVAMTSEINQELADKFEVKAIAQQTDSDTKSFDRLTKLVEDKIVKPHVDKVFTLDQTKAAFEYAEKGHPKGKVVVKIK